MRIIALSASALDHERAAVSEAGCDDFLAKPFRESAIFDKLAEHLGVRYIHEEEPAAGSGSPVTGVLTAERLGALSPELRVPLRKALEIGDDEAALKSVASIRAADPPLADALADALGKFQVDELLSLLERVGE